MNDAKQQVKEMLKTIISETLSKKKMLNESYNYEKELSLEIKIGQKWYLAKGIFTCDVESSRGGFEYDRPFGGDRAQQPETNSEVINQHFGVNELFSLIDQGENKEFVVGEPIKKEAALRQVETYINKTYDFRAEEDAAIEASSGQ